MNLDKSKKRIAKKIKMGFQGYPMLTIIYSGDTPAVAAQVSLTYIVEEGAEAMVECFTSKMDVREDEVVQSAIVKMIERSGVKTVEQAEGVNALNK
ncbi:hypothetical protein [Teredinibacter purpureus]|uniref:hypothetical protein n=1 Tax=Teredinibacter purpureus TaxID=2731756 RepID=UPI0005F7E5CF|nr:hypothetical protein [Teredinibacter purpureus]